jgi:hypothetical protein
MSRKQVNSKGRPERGSFIALPEAVINSREFARLSAYGVKLFINVCAQFNGRNNGDLCAAWTLMRELGWRYKSRSCTELQRNYSTKPDLWCLDKVLGKRPAFVR